MERIKKFLYSKQNLYILGAVVIVCLSVMEVWGEKNFNFMVYAEATRDFWSGIDPYTPEWSAAHRNDFLYGPAFLVIFAPFAYLPGWLSPILWNLMNFTLLSLSIFTLPDKYTKKQKCKTFLYIFLILAVTQLGFQYNVVVAYCFLFAFSLLERGRAFWAIALIMLSGFTKVYGFFELGLLLFYPHLWRNIGYTLLLGGMIFALPLLKLAPPELLSYYGKWLGVLSDKGHTMGVHTFFYMKPLLHKLQPYAREIQAAILGAIALLTLIRHKRWGDFAFRAQVLGIIMCYAILLSSSAYKHTYLIALIGYMLWYRSRKPSDTDRVLFWLNFLLLCVMPVDILFPVAVMDFICNTLYLHLWMLLFTWLRMIYITFVTNETQADHNRAGLHQGQS